MRYVLLLLGMLWTWPAGAATLAELEASVNALRSLQADIIQTNPDGSVAEGTLTIQRPGRMRLAYRTPYPSLMVADGTFLHYWDAELEQTSSGPLAETLAALLLREPLRFGGDIVVRDQRTDHQLLAVELALRDEPGAGTLTLLFEQQPLQLRAWRVTDAGGAVTNVMLQNLQANPTPDRQLFVYRPPNFARRDR